MSKYRCELNEISENWHVFEYQEKQTFFFSLKSLLGLKQDQNKQR